MWKTNPLSTEKAIAPLLPATQSDIDQAQRSARLKYLTFFALLLALAANMATVEGWLGISAGKAPEDPVYYRGALFAWGLLAMFYVWSIYDIRVCDPIAATALTGNTDMQFSERIAADLLNGNGLVEIHGLAAQHPEVEAFMNAITSQPRAIQRYDLWVAKDWVEGRYARHLRSGSSDTISVVLRVAVLIGATVIAFHEPWFAGWFRWFMAAFSAIVLWRSFAHVFRTWNG